MNVGHNAKLLWALLSELLYWSDLASTPPSVFSPKPLTVLLLEKTVKKGCLCQCEYDSPFGSRKAQQRQLLVWISSANISVLMRLCGSALHRFSVSCVRNTLMSQQQVWSRGCLLAFSPAGEKANCPLLVSLLVISSLLDGYHHSFSFLSFPPFHLPSCWIEAIAVFSPAEADWTVCP